MAKFKIVYKNTGKVTMDKTTNIYKLNTISGKVSKADLMPLDNENGNQTFRLIEEKNCMYLPALSQQYAEREFDVIFKNAKAGVIKLSWREKWAKFVKLFKIWWSGISGR